MQNTLRSVILMSKTYSTQPGSNSLLVLFYSKTNFSIEISRFKKYILLLTDFTHIFSYEYILWLTIYFCADYRFVIVCVFLSHFSFHQSQGQQQNPVSFFFLDYYYYYLPLHSTLTLFLFIKTLSSRYIIRYIILVTSQPAYDVNPQVLTTLLHNMT